MKAPQQLNFNLLYMPKNSQKIEAFAMFCNGKLLNDNGEYCKAKDTPAIALSARAFTKGMAEENGWDVVPITITYKL